MENDDLRMESDVSNISMNYEPSFIVHNFPLFGFAS